MNNIPRMLKLKDASQETGLSYNFLRQLCLTNQIVFVRAGNKYFINMDKLIDFLNGEKQVQD